jgi:hypothetical protein
MKALASLLGTRERRTLTTLAMVFGAIVAGLVILGVRARIDAGRAATLKKGVEARWLRADRELALVRNEWDRWTRAARDEAELRTSWFYDAADGASAFRLDLQKVLEAAGLRVPDIGFGEVDLVKDRLRRVTAEFTIMVGYAGFRRFLEIVESHPRAFHVEKVDFRDVGGTTGALELRVILSGYYLHETK